MIPAFVINLDRRPDRLAFMAPQLDALGVPWHRISALDAKTASDAAIATEVMLTGHRIGMGRGSQCCAVTNFDIFRRIVAEGIPAALIVQDDVALSPDLAPLLEADDWIPEGIGLIQLEHTGRSGSTRLVGPALGPLPVPGHSLRQLHSRTGGAGAFIVTQRAAQIILRDKPVLDAPIDHFLFSPNVSPVYDRLGVALMMPAMAVQRTETLSSDIISERSRRPKSMGASLRRLWSEVNRTPQQVAAMIKGARWQSFDLPRRTFQ
jgi:glycosyl transferase, family 25